MLYQDAARSHGGSKNTLPLMSVIQQITERKGRRICLEESLPGLIISSSVFPVSKRGGKGLVLWACKEYVTSGMLGLRSAGLAECGFVRMELLSIFARRGVICQGAGHTANGRYVIPGQSREESLARLIGDIGFELPTYPFNWEPAAALVRMGRGENAPVSCHVPLELADEVQPQDLEGSGRAYSGALFHESIRTLVSLDSDVRRAICEGEDVVGGRKMVFKYHIDPNRGHLTGVRVEVKERRENRLAINEEDGALNVVDDDPLDSFFKCCELRVKRGPGRAPSVMIVPVVIVIYRECVCGARGFGPIRAIGEYERAVVGFEILYLLLEVVDPSIEKLRRALGRR